MTVDFYVIKQMQQDILDAHQEINKLRNMNSLLGTVSLLPSHTERTIKRLLDTDEVKRQLVITYLLKYGSAELRQWIVKILGAIGDASGLPALIAISENDPFTQEKTVSDEPDLDYYDRERVTIHPIREAAKMEIEKIKGKD